MKKKNLSEGSGVCEAFHKCITEADLGGGAGGALPHPPPYFLQLLFRNHLQAGDVSISLGSWKYRVSPLNDISIAKNRLQSPKF